MSEGLSLEEINQKYPDVLREIGNIGAGNATTAIASMLSLRMNMSVPSVEFLPVEEMSTALGSEDAVIAGIMLGVDGDIGGSMMFLLDMPSAKNLANHMMGMMGGPPIQEEYFLDEEKSMMARSAIQEIGNIIAGAYLNAIASMTNLTITPTPPFVAFDTAASILSVPAIIFGSEGDNALLIRTEIDDEQMDERIRGYYFLMPEGNSYQKIFAGLGLPV